MVIDTLEHLVHLDGRFTGSVVSLLFYPGRITSSFLAGKRASQVPPLRFYLFVSLLFFLTLPLRTDLEFAPLASISTTDGIRQAEAILAEIHEAQPYSGSDFLQGLREGLTFEELAADAETSPQDRKILQELDNLVDRFSNPQEFVDFLLRHAPNVLFFSLPVLAFMTRILFLKAKYTYLEHMAVALHLGTFYFSVRLVEEG
ncbi:MAG: DUF3667 domain-containing protein [Candidatus Synoicihabitans palmerolidicus]|nr:DUF3667 domain-containing protein [Candidatus Synoicihabitans palmerolidicus]